MFIDVCYPDGNEEEFIKVAGELGTKKLCFLYDNQRKIEGHYSASYRQRGNSFSFLDIEKKIPFMKNHIYCIHGLCQEKKHFNKPTKLLTQVYMKEIKGSIIGISFDEILNNPKELEKMIFLAGLAKKYGIPLFIASFARTPLRLRQKEDLLSFSRFVTGDHALAKKSLDVLFSRLTESF
ncbi:MAG: hypothetical protein NDI94_04130 [Candidatus Woesearchaeota archaeon]|nr:hypothetical protein [Candidatus Woesearchaeota archaeon]